MRFRTVLFDLDGTLMDHLPAIHRSYVHTLPLLGLPAPTYQQVKNAIGGGLENAMLNFVPPSRLDEALAIYRPFWDATMLSGAELMPGARVLLEQLRAAGVVCAVFTNKHGPSARLVCEHLGVTPLLAGVFGAKDTPWLKPAREFADHALAALGADPATTCLIGDSPWDVQAALNAHFPCFGVTTGTHGANELRAAGAAGVYDSLTAIGSAELGVT
ncbi:MAG: HAD family hydrolase [Opitutaceae bacterium]|jgi:phosphoglycolate phosphatase